MRYRAEACVDCQPVVCHIMSKEVVVQYHLVSGDNHIDLTYCPPDLWSSQAPAKWKLLVPRVEELDDGLH